jgi:hypothetical protein
MKHADAFSGEFSLKKARLIGNEKFFVIKGELQ